MDDLKSIFVQVHNTRNCTQCLGACRATESTVQQPRRLTGEILEDEESVQQGAISVAQSMD